ncbi:MAG: EVE domain-containing protein [Methylococcaceae bacterium]
MNYWLLKSEPSQFSIDDLYNRPEKTEPWNGVRNYQARNFLCSMQLGDLAFFYHSNCNTVGIVGLMQISKTAYPDETAFNPEHIHYDAKSSPEKPRWFQVDVQYLQHFSRTITLQELKQYPQLAEFTLLQRGNRLSVMPVKEMHWQFILNEYEP